MLHKLMLGLIHYIGFLVRSFICVNGSHLPQNPWFEGVSPTMDITPSISGLLCPLKMASVEEKRGGNSCFNNNFDGIYYISWTYQ